MLQRNSLSMEKIGTYSTKFEFNEKNVFDYKNLRMNVENHFDIDESISEKYFIRHKFIKEKEKENHFDS